MGTPPPPPHISSWWNVEPGIWDLGSKQEQTGQACGGIEKRAGLMQKAGYRGMLCLFSVYILYVDGLHRVASSSLLFFLFAVGGACAGGFTVYLSPPGSTSKGARSTESSNRLRRPPSYRYT